MGPFEIRRTALRELRAARKAMGSAEFVFALERRDEETQREAAFVLLRVQSAIRHLEDVDLSQIRDALLENEDALRQGRDRLRRALERLTRVKDVLNTVSTILGSLGRILGFIG